MSTPLRTTDTIAAIATAAGRGAIGIVRLSGPLAHRILRVVVPSLKGAITGRILSGWARDPRTGTPIDHVVALAFDEARSSTGEKAAELQAHGGPAVLEQLLEAALWAGAVPAPPGEFTRRAFLNGRMDLLQAEAVAQLVAAKGERAARASARQLAGSLTGAIERARAPLLEALVELEAELDFADEDLPDADREHVRRLLEASHDALDRLHGTWRTSSRIFEGVRVVIAGPPNAGKSSLFNRLLGRDRALVHPEPGTTRDYLEASTAIAGIAFTLVDTAGLREAPGSVERRGIEMSIEAAASADVILLVVDSAGIDGHSLDSLARAAPDAEVLVAENKTDLPDRMGPGPAALLDGFERHEVSASTGDGLDGLRASLGHIAVDRADPGSAVLACVRHRDLVGTAAQDISRTLAALASGTSSDVLAGEIRTALSRLDELTGREAVPELLDAIFGRFCVGK